MKRSKRLTLFEAVILGLVLLFVAGVLLALLFPAVSSGPPPRNAQAKNDVTQIATAVNAFVTEYGILPSTNRGNVGGELLATLMGGIPSLNPRGLVFLEVNPAGYHRSGHTNGTFVDPWGGPYQVAFDTDYQNSITNAGTNAATIVRKIVAVWSDPSLGPDASSLSETKKARRYVNSWE